MNLCACAMRACAMRVRNACSIRQHTSAHLRSVLLCKHVVCAMRACRLRANFLDILPPPLVQSGSVDDFIVLEILLQTYLSLGTKRSEFRCYNKFRC